MSMASEFKEFALKGNVMDLAVGVIISAVFGKIDFPKMFLVLGHIPKTSLRSRLKMWTSRC